MNQETKKTVNQPNKYISLGFDLTGNLSLCRLFIGKLFKCFQPV